MDDFWKFLIVFLVVVVPILGSIIWGFATSWMRQDGEGEPKTGHGADDRIKMLGSENAQLRAEVGSLKGRLETIERIVTDPPHRLALDIDALAHDKGGRG